MLQAPHLTHALHIRGEADAQSRQRNEKITSVGVFRPPTDVDLRGLSGQHETEIQTPRPSPPLSHQEAASLCKVTAFVRQGCFQLNCGWLEFHHRKRDCGDVITSMCSYRECRDDPWQMHMMWQLIW